MRIVDYDVYRLPPRWLFVRLETDEGLVGWGEHVIGGGPKPVAAAVETLADRYLVDADPLRITDHWERMYRGGFYRGGPVLMAAMAGLDMALWDLKGKYYDAPIHELLGGRSRDRIRVYQWIGGDRPSDVAANASARMGEGFTAFKMNATAEFQRIETPAAVSAAVERVETVRDAVGDTVDIAVDFHGRVSRPMAKRLVEALDPHWPMFVEEPVLPDHLGALPEIARHTTTPIATGERLFTRWDFRSVLESGAVDVVQPDLAQAGGITECVRIASLAETHDVAFAPHCPLGPVALAACLQVDAVAPNALIQEQSLNIHYNRDADLLDYLADPAVFDFEDGFVPVPTEPGLGIDVDGEAVRAAAKDASEWEPEIGLHRPVWRHDDGSVAEW